MVDGTIAQFLQSADTKFYLTLGGLLWAVFRGFNWVKDIRQKDLKGIKDDLGTQTNVISAGFASLYDGVKELRNDFRTFYTSPNPLMMPVSSRPTRKRKPAARPAAKKSKPAKKKSK